MMARNGFTLIEMLAAVTVFLVGFLSVFTLFIGGVRFRQAAETTTRTGIAINNLTANLRILTVDPAVARAEPEDFLGDGDPRTAPPPPGLGPTVGQQFVAVPGMPGMMYRISAANYLVQEPTLRPIDPARGGTLAGGSLLLTLHIAAVPAEAPDGYLPESLVLRYLGARGSETAADLVDRGVITQQQLILYRP
jgi:prepilin-type N-terminal cleavage/methylation domain-containing protein